MHIPDNFLSTPVWATLDGIAIPAVAIVSRQAQRATESNRLPLLGVMGAFVFAAQMINFPVGLGTSGHLVGGTLLACVLGPWAAALVITAILIVQALIFQDGGVLALGANVINMALIGVVFGYLPARALSRTKWKGVGVFLGGTCSVLVSGVLALSELLLSGIRMSSPLVAVSLGLFAVNAVLEGGITVSVLGAMERLDPSAARGLISDRKGTGNARLLWPKLVVSAGLAAVTLAGLGIMVASTLPDGVQHLGQKIGLPLAAPPTLHSPLRDYNIQALGSNWISRAGAGLIGLVLVYLICALGSHLLGRTRRSYS
ncbi:MAG: energy-coupling factor ABC transporter permease [Acidobacteriaceae bacterium]|nr:energy-coupling factor ABC transporter permease [Acidobacteriaceae bacterium]MBV9779642.1 energy-coupling factor ABC transporter permease [Acidobacteriaceae bacterium]